MDIYTREMKKMDREAEEVIKNYYEFSKKMIKRVAKAQHKKTYDKKSIEKGISFCIECIEDMNKGLKLKSDIYLKMLKSIKGKI